MESVCSESPCQPDWDMFQTDHPTSYIHAIARAVGGCAIYVSDKPEKHNFELLSSFCLPLTLARLVLADGSILRARQPGHCFLLVSQPLTPELPGRPTRDCLFLNVMQDDRTALKVPPVCENLLTRVQPSICRYHLDPLMTWEGEKSNAGSELVQEEPATCRTQRGGLECERQAESEGRRGQRQA
eukprot:107850-Hanusia_phi.AAC.1